MKNPLTLLDMMNTFRNVIVIMDLSLMVSGNLFCIVLPLMKSNARKNTKNQQSNFLKK